MIDSSPAFPIAEAGTAQAAQQPELEAAQLLVAGQKRQKTQPRPGQHVDGGSLAEIFVGRSATRWLRL